MNLRVNKNTTCGCVEEFVLAIASEGLDRIAELDSELMGSETILRKSAYDASPEVEDIEQEFLAGLEKLEDFYWSVRRAELLVDASFCKPQLIDVGLDGRVFEADRLFSDKISKGIEAYSETSGYDQSAANKDLRTTYLSREGLFPFGPLLDQEVTKTELHRARSELQSTVRRLIKET